jgi:peptide/nickel transport system substrate-binding protein
VAAACGGDDDDGGDGDAAATEAASEDGGTPAESTTTTARDEGEPVQGGTITVGLEGESAGWRPGTGSWASSGYNVAYAIMDPLMARTEDGSIEPYLAESLEPNEDYTEYTLTLREGVTFHERRVLRGDGPAHRRLQPDRGQRRLPRRPHPRVRDAVLPDRRRDHG